MLIPTIHKPRIGAHLAYPIGAEQLSAAIGDLPQAAEMTVTFIAPNRFRPAVWRFSDRPYEVLEFRYQKRKPGISTPRAWSEYGPPGTSPWQTWISAVPKKTVSAIRALLSDKLLKSVRPWLQSQEAASQREGSARLVLCYDPVAMQLTATAEDKLLPKKTAKR